MKQRKVTKGVLEIVSQHINISFEYLYKLYKDGYLNDKRIFQFLEKALYQQGKIKRNPIG